MAKSINCEDSLMFAYAIGLGSNQRHVRWGHPRSIVQAAIAALDAHPDCIVAGHSNIMTSRPIGPSQRSYANAALILLTPKTPYEVLQIVQSIEMDFWRKRRGQRWRARTLDLDILLWSGGPISSRILHIPHLELAHRDFVLSPLVQIARDWRIGCGALRVCHAHAQLHRQLRHKD
jgi:2-amino-4-hydroxy-6-hydroxymethyldihydropteridine diphosphokinase